MKKILIALALILFPALAQAQCNGIFPNNTICGNVSGTNNTARPVSTSVLTGIPGGSNGQVQYNNAGAFGGLTAAQLTALINPFTSVLSGVVPLSGGGTTNFLRADGTWVAPTNSTYVVGPASATDNALARFDATTGKLLQDSQITLGDTDGKLTRATGISVSGGTGTATAAGYKGELLTTEITYASRITIISGTITQILTMAMTAGDWDCNAVAGFETTGGGVATEYHVEISTTPLGVVAAPNSAGTVGVHLTAIANQGQVFPAGPRQVIINSLTNVYLKALSTFTNNQTAYGFLRCRRL